MSPIESSKLPLRSSRRSHLQSKQLRLRRQVPLGSPAVLQLWAKSGPSPSLGAHLLLPLGSKLIESFSSPLLAFNLQGERISSSSAWCLFSRMTCRGRTQVPVAQGEAMLGLKL